MSRTVRVGVVGRRFGQDVHVPAFRADERCEVVAVAGHDGWRDLVASAEVDVVSIAVPPAAQPAIIIEAARCGKHVFCEKPVASSVDAAREALSAVERAGVVHGVDFLFPEVPSWREARALLAAGTIGALRHFSYTWRVETHANRLNLDTWKGRPQDGGGALGNFVSHVFYNIEWLLGPIAALDGFTFPGAPRTGRAVDGIVRLEDGVTGTVSVSTDAFLGCGHVVELFGDLGTARLRNAGPDYVSGFELSAGTRQSGVLAPLTTAAAASGDGRLAAITPLVRRLVDAVSGGPAMTPNLAHGLRVQELLSLAAESRGASRTVPPPILEHA